MNTPKYNRRLPQLRISNELMEALEARAAAQNISLAAAHRQILNIGLGNTALVIPKAGTMTKAGIITPNEYWPKGEAA